MGVKNRRTMPLRGIRPIALVAVLACGCQLDAPRIVPAPLTPHEQQLAILDLVPPGTPRETALRTLEEAGIEGGFGATNAQSVYYCDLWDRGDGTLWHLDVSVLFDESGRVINLRPGTHTTNVVSATERAAPPRRRTVAETIDAASDFGETTSPTNRARRNRRTAFLSE